MPVDKKDPARFSKRYDWLLTNARKDALALIGTDPGLSSPEWTKLRKQVLTRYGKALELGDVG